ncbi:MAG TPA: alpha/beta fold hydrolase [Actinomycetota bacterium]|jgi:dipeptidyl aminopeptidase/acylaminoacyl peptidase|nr:alpha/beta fold hydrolase [Actinomycetota bacterium]
MRARALIVVVHLFAAALVVPTAAADPACSNVPGDRQMSNRGIRLTQALGLASGKYSLPATKRPRQMVVMMHGYGNDSCSWRNHLRRVASRGAVGVAMDYTGQDPKTNRGWRVEEGGEDSIKAARYFLEQYPSIRQVFAFGISMGGNAAGLMVADPSAKRANGRPLFDHWVAIEGVHNLIQEYATFNQVSAEFREDVEEEAGGSPAEVPDRYVELTNLAHAADMAYLRSAILVHGVDDLLVQPNQSRDMALQLRRVGVATELFTVVGRGDGEAGTTITGLGPETVAPDAGYESPVAGHGWEGSDTQLVIRLGFEQLWKVMAGKRTGPYRETIVHGEGLRIPLP